MILGVICDILMAFVVALLLELVSLGSKYLKKIIILVSCTTIIFAYFINNCKINFAGEIDLAIWIVFIIIFDIILSTIVKKFKKLEIEDSI